MTVLELAPSRGKEAGQQQAEESERVLKMLEKMEGEVWLLDERGKAMTSPEFAAEMGRAKDMGRELVFVLGGAYGFTEGVRNKIAKKLRLSDMVLPHELCRVVFLEQVYRAGEIGRGSGYHHG